MTEHKEEQQGQTPQVVLGPQTNVDSVVGAVLSGVFEDKVEVGPNITLVDAAPDWPSMIALGIGTGIGTGIGAGIARAVVRMLTQASNRRKEKLEAEKAHPSEVSSPDRDATLAKNIEFLDDALSARKDTQKDLRALVQALGSDQRAVRLAGCYLKQFTDLTVNDYLTKWQQVLDGIPSGERLGEESKVQVIAAIALNWEQVKSESARSVFWVAGYCSPDCLIPSRLLQISTRLESEAYEQSLQALVNFGLLEPDRENVGCLVDPILAVFSRNSYREPLAPLYFLVNAFITRMPDSSTLLPLELPHAEAVFAAAEEYLAQSREYLPRKSWGVHRVDTLSYCQELQSLLLGGLIARHVRRGNIAEARNLAHKSLELAQKMGDEHGMALMLARLSEVASVKGDHTQALEYGRRALVISRELADKRGVGWVLLKLSDIASKQGDYHRAICYGEEALCIFELADERGVAWAHLKLSDVASKQGDYHRAIEYSQRALSIFRDLADEQDVVWDHLRLSDITDMRGDYDQSLGYVHRSLGIFRKLADQWGMLLAYHKESRALRLSGKYQESEEWLEESRRCLDQALEIAGQATLVSLIPDLQAELGRVFRDVGSVKSASPGPESGRSFYSQSEEQLRKALESEEWDRIDAADTWLDLAQVLYALGNPDEEVKQCLEEAEHVVGGQFVIKAGEHIPDMGSPRSEFAYLGKAEAFRGKMAFDQGRFGQGFEHLFMAYVYFTLSPQRFDFKPLYVLLRDLSVEQLVESFDTAKQWADQMFGEERMRDFWSVREWLIGL